MLRSTGSLINASILFLIIPLCLVPTSAYRYKFYGSDFKYSRPCKNNTFDPYTGNFKCTVETGGECFMLCQEYGCNEWSFLSFMPSSDSNVRDHYRCRCDIRSAICSYNYISPYNRDYE